MTDVAVAREAARVGGAPVRVAHLVSHPIQYFAPLYRELARRPEIQLTVYFYSDETVRAFVDPEFGRAVAWDVPLLDGYRARILPSATRTAATAGIVKRPNWDVVREVVRERYEVLWVNGYAHSTTWAAVAAARIAGGAQVLIRDEQTLLHGRPPATRLAKQVALRALYSQASALYIGEESRRYFEHYGVPPDRLFAARYCVDNDFFSARADELAPRRSELRASFGIDNDAPVILFVGKLVSKKDPLVLLEAFARVRHARPCWLLFVGDGALRDAIDRRVQAERIPNVLVAGFRNQSELPDAYAASDVFALPSAFHETWGLVVNEAMNFGLPVVVSDKVGCAADLVPVGETGFVVQSRDAEALARALASLVDDAPLRRRLGDAARARVARYSIGACADGIVAASVTRARVVPRPAAAGTG